MDWSAMLLDEIALAGQEHLDPAYVAAYDRKAGFDPTEELVLLRELGLGEQSTLVDLGAGTGTLKRGAAFIASEMISRVVLSAMHCHGQPRAANDDPLAERRAVDLECVAATRTATKRKVGSGGGLWPGVRLSPRRR